MQRYVLSRAAARLSAPRRGFGAPAGAGSEAYPFGIKPGTYVREGWEGITYTAYAASTLLLVVGLANKPDTDIREWAKEEAKARNQVKANGGEVEWGTHYSGFEKYTFTKEDVGEVPELVVD